MWEYNYTDELYHYGVKGMKWGVRRDSRVYKRTSKRLERTEKHIKKRLEKSARPGKMLLKTLNKRFNRTVDTYAAIGDYVKSFGSRGKKAVEKLFGKSNSKSIVSTQKRKKRPGEIHERPSESKVMKKLDALTGINRKGQNI